MQRDGEYFRADVVSCEVGGRDVSTVDFGTEYRVRDASDSPRTSVGSWEFVGGGRRNGRDIGIVEDDAASFHSAATLATPTPFLENSNETETRRDADVDILGLANEYVSQFRLSSIDGDWSGCSSSGGRDDCDSSANTDRSSGGSSLSSSGITRRGATSEGVRALAGGKLSTMFRREFRTVLPRRRIVHEVYERGIHRQTGRRLVEIGERYRNGAFVVIALHGDHRHVIHDCSFSAGTCRCALISEISNLVRRYKRRIFRSGEYTVGHYVHLVEYLETGERRIQYLQVGRRSWRNDSEIGKIFGERSLATGSTELVERSGIPMYASDTENASDSTSSQSVRKRDGSVFCKQSRSLEAGDKFARWLRQFAVSPLAYVFQLRAFSESEWRYTARTNSMFVTVLHNFATELNGYSTLEIFKFVNKLDPQFAVYNAPHGDIKEYYYDMDTSVQIMRTLLL